MDEQKKIEHLVNYLSSKGIKKNISYPPFYRFLSKIGINLKPPHYAGILVNTIIYGGSFSIIWGYGMWFMQWKKYNMDINKVVILSIGAGLFFGIFYSLYFKYQAKKYKLPKNWENYPINK